MIREALRAYFAAVCDRSGIQWHQFSAQTSITNVSDSIALLVQQRIKRERGKPMLASIASGGDVRQRAVDQVSRRTEHRGPARVRCGKSVCDSAEAPGPAEREAIKVDYLVIRAVAHNGRVH